jgi:hypothetical protein
MVCKIVFLTFFEIKMSFSEVEREVCDFQSKNYIFLTVLALPAWDTVPNTCPGENMKRREVT